mmetsp:Transcript_15184/g.26025  ORF Transcript_15184/g.26025 Transcript_15184/m.26025 type:complete len:227 (+) Transcript_15184:265-945(+)
MCPPRSPARSPGFASPSSTTRNPTTSSPPPTTCSSTPCSPSRRSSRNTTPSPFSPSTTSSRASPRTQLPPLPSPPPLLCSALLCPLPLALSAVPSASLRFLWHAASASGACRVMAAGVGVTWWSPHCMSHLACRSRRPGDSRSATAAAARLCCSAPLANHLSRHEIAVCMWACAPSLRRPCVLLPPHPFCRFATKCHVVATCTVCTRRAAPPPQRQALRSVQLVLV